MTAFTDDPERERFLEEMARDLALINASREEARLCVAWSQTEMPRLPCSLIVRIHALRLARHAIEKAREAALQSAARKP